MIRYYKINICMIIIYLISVGNIAGTELDLISNKINPQRGETFDISVIVKDDFIARGIDIRLLCDSNYVSFESIEYRKMKGFDWTAYRLTSEGMLAVSGFLFHEPLTENYSFAANDTLVDITFTRMSSDRIMITGDGNAPFSIDDKWMTNSAEYNDLVFNTITGVDDDPSYMKDRQFTVRQFPNPSQTGQINFSIVHTYEKLIPVDIKIYNVLGKLVWSYQDIIERGSVQINWDGITEYGKAVPTGLYLYQVISQHQYCTGKCLIVR